MLQGVFFYWSPLNLAIKKVKVWDFKKIVNFYDVPKGLKRSKRVKKGPKTTKKTKNQNCELWGRPPPPFWKKFTIFFFFLGPSLTNPKSSPISSRLKGAAGCAPDRSTGRLWLAWTLTKPNPASVTKPNQTSRYIQLYCFR